MGGIFSRYTRTDEVDALETPAEPDRVGLTPTEQILLTWVFHDKCKVHTKYSEMHAYWVQVNFQALCYYKPKLIERIDTNRGLCLNVYMNKLFSVGGPHYSCMGCRYACTCGYIKGAYSQVCLTIYKNKLFSGSYNKTIRVWDADTHAHGYITGAYYWVYCLTIYKEQLFSGSVTETIRVWDADTHAQVTTLQGHTSSVYCLTIYKNKLFSGSQWPHYSCMGCRYACTCVYITGAYLECVCLTIYKNKLFSGSMTGTIRVWDADTHAHVATLQGHTDGVYCLTIYKNKLFSGSVTTLFVYGMQIRMHMWLHYRAYQ